MNIYDDYAEYMAEKEKTIKEIKNHAPNVFSVIEDVIKVCDYIWNEHNKGSKIEEELGSLFETGFGYISNVLSDLEIILKDFFNNDFDTFNYYESLIVYNILVEDTRCHLESNELLDNDKKKAINDIEEEIDNILANKKTIDETTVEKYEDRLVEIVPEHHEFKPVYVIYSLICDQLNLI